MKINQQGSGKPSKSRMIGGTIVLVSGFLSPLLIPMVLASNLSSALKSVLSGLLAFGIPEIFMLVAIGIFGKAGFNYIKKYISLVIKAYGPPDEVSKTRYNIGLVFFLIPILFAFVIPYLFSHIEFIADNYVVIAIAGDCLIIIGLFVLGGNFWDKLRGLFIHQAIAVIKTKKND